MTFENFQRIQARRDFLRNGAGGLGMIALAQMLGAATKRTDPLAPKPPHFAPRQFATASASIFTGKVRRESNSSAALFSVPASPCRRQSRLANIAQRFTSSAAASW